jgi:hypothetical protein
VSVTVLPILNPLLHNVPQVIPAGDDEIDPKSEPVPLSITCKFPVVALPAKVAVHVLGPFITTEAPDPLTIPKSGMQSPVQIRFVGSGWVGRADRDTLAPTGKLNVQVP